MKIKGYRRENGRWGIRNHLLVIPTSVCASETASRIAGLVPGAVPEKAPPLFKWFVCYLLFFLLVQ